MTEPIRISKAIRILDKRIRFLSDIMDEESSGTPEVQIMTMIDVVVQLNKDIVKLKELRTTKSVFDSVSKAIGIITIGENDKFDYEYQICEIISKAPLNHQSIKSFIKILIKVIDAYQTATADLIEARGKSSSSAKKSEVDGDVLADILTRLEKLEAKNH